MTAKKRGKANKALQALDITLPTGWGELTPAQVSRVAFYLSQSLEQTEYLARLAGELADLKPRGSSVTHTGEIVYRFYHRSRGNVLLSAESITAITRALKWTMEEVTPMAAPLLDGYRTPDDALYGVTLEQYLTAESACSAYMRTQAHEPLRVLVAALYLRGPFDPQRIEAEARRLRLLPLWQLQAVFLWFTGVKQVLCEKFPFVFSAESDPGAPTIPGDEMMLGLLSSLNEGRVVDNEKLKKTDIYEIFYELNLKIKTAKERR